MCDGEAGRARGSEGYLVLEAAIAIPIYLFFMFLILQLSSVAIVQAKVSTAVNQAAVSLSQVSYTKSSAVTQDAASVITAVESFISIFTGPSGSDESDNPFTMMRVGTSDVDMATRVVKSELATQDATLSSLGLVSGADGVTFDETTTTVLSGERIRLEGAYEVRLWFFGERRISMTAVAETARWGDPEVKE